MLVLDRVERVLEIAQQVAPVLDADGNANQTVGYASQVLLLLRKARVRGGLRVAHQGFHPSQRHRDVRQFYAAQELESRFAAAQLSDIIAPGYSHCARRMRIWSASSNSEG